MTVYRIHPEEKHIKQLSRTMREYDRREIAMLGKTPEFGLRYSVNNSSKVFCYCEDGKVLMMVGVCPAMGDVGVIWMISTEETFSRKRMQFIRETKGVLEELSEGYSTLYNIIHQNNHKAIRWLKYLGFEFSNFNGHPEFLLFTQRFLHKE